MPIAFHNTRLAPSPTGALHLGHARTFLITWWLARQSHANIFMRMEDLDAGRAKPESVQQAYDDLHWLGMDWDPYPETQNPILKTQNEVVQSERMPLYHDALEKLWRQNAIYPCTCTRAEIAAVVAHSASAPHESDAHIRYPGTCGNETRNATLKTQNVKEVERIVQEETGKNVCWRLRVPRGALAFEDTIAGPQAFDVNADAGDFPLTRFDRTPAYQLACAVDDHAMAIDLVVRGDDLLSSTPRQLLIYRALGLNPPRFAHVPLVIGPDGKRLAKRHGESRIAQFRAAHTPPEKIVGWAAWRTGQIDSPREVTAQEITAHFDLAKLPRQRIILGKQDFAWLKEP